MSWTTRPKFDVRTFVHAACAAAEQRRQTAEPIPDAPYFQEEADWREGRIKLGRRSVAWRKWVDAEAWVDWMDEDWWHAGVILGAWVLVMFVGTVWLLGMMR